jgi:hypothetical protein
MDKICENCRFWRHYEQTGCDRPSDSYREPSRGIVAACGPRFGCVHFEAKAPKIDPHTPKRNG